MYVLCLLTCLSGQLSQGIVGKQGSLGKYLLVQSHIINVNLDCGVETGVQV